MKYELEEPKFTWSNNRRDVNFTKERLGRVVANSKWHEIFNEGNYVGGKVSNFILIVINQGASLESINDNHYNSHSKIQRSVQGI